MKQVRSFAIGVFLSGAAFSSSVAHAHSYKILNWLDYLSPDVASALSKAGDGISEVLFSLVNDISVTVVSDPMYSVDLSIQRQVFQNGTETDAYTIVDRLGVGGRIPIVSPSTATSGVDLSFYIGTNGGVDFINIRQLKKNQLETLQTELERKSELEKEPRFQDFVENRGQETGSDGEWVRWISDRGSQLRSFLTPDSLNQARYSKIWNFFLTPFRLPLTVDSLRRLDDGEIISYLGRGAIELGMGAGVSVDPMGVSGILEAGISISTFVRGQYRVSLLKKSNEVARVRVTRDTTTGGGVRFGGGYKPSLLDQIVLVNQINEVLKVVPIQLSEERFKNFQVDLCFEYDLTSETGRQAYEQAALGRLKMSDDLSMNERGGWRESRFETGVVRILERNRETDSTAPSRSMRLTIGFTRDSRGAISNVVTSEVRPDGVHHYFTALARNSKEWQLVWKWFEKSQHNFLVSLNLDQKRAESFPLQVEGRIRDSHTSGHEFGRYVREVQENVGVGLHLPKFEEDAEMGGTTIYYQANYTPDQVQEFIQTPEEQMWPLLERAFKVSTGTWGNTLWRFFYYFTRSPVSALDVPLNFLQLNLKPGTDLAHAQSFKSAWQSLREKSDVKDQAEAFGAMFLDFYYSRQFAHLVRLRLSYPGAGYFIDVSNDHVKHLSLKEGNGGLPVNPGDERLFFLR